MVFVEEHSNKSMNEIRKLPFPEFKNILLYLGDPESFLKSETLEDKEAKMKMIKKANQEMMRKARERKQS
jgi:hypothetical protein